MRNRTAAGYRTSELPTFNPFSSSRPVENCKSPATAVVITTLIFNGGHQTSPPGEGNGVSRKEEQLVVPLKILKRPPQEVT